MPLFIDNKWNNGIPTSAKFINLCVGFNIRALTAVDRDSYPSGLAPDETGQYLEGFANLHFEPEVYLARFCRTLARHFKEPHLLLGPADSRPPDYHQPPEEIAEQAHQVVTEGLFSCELVRSN